jgi:PAS domain S-box-containing protein
MERLLRVAGKFANVGGWELEFKNGNLLWSNETYAIHDLPVGQPVAMEDAINFYLPEYRAPIQLQLQRCREQGSSFDLEAQILTAKNRRIWVRAIGEAVRDGKGDVIGLQGALQDISDLKARIQDAEQKDALLRIAHKVARIGGWMVDLESQESTWSEEIFEMLEWPDRVSPSLGDALNLYPPHWRRVVEDMLMSSAKDGLPFDFEAEILTARGNQIWVRVVGTPEFTGQGRLPRLQGAFQDLTERKTLEQTLAASEWRFRQLADSTPMIVWSALPDGQVDYSNRQFSKYTGVSADLPAATRWQETLHPHDQERCHQAWQRCLQSREPFEIEYRIRRGEDRSYRWFAVQANPIYDGDGHIFKWYGTAIDIHEIKTLEQEATQLAERLTVTLESFTDAFVTLDHLWRFTYANEEALRLTGRSRDQLLGSSLWDVFPETVGGTFEQEYRRAVAEQTPANFEEYYGPLQGWFEVRAYPSSEGLAISFRNVTERRQNQEALRESEERFQLLSKATNDVIWDWNLLSDSIWWNEGVETMFGHQRSSLEPGSESWTSRIHPDDQDQIVSGVQEAIDRGDEGWSGEYRFQRADGSYAFVLDRGYIIRDSSGQAVRLIGSVTDLSERKKLEEQFLRSQRLESIGTLAGGIAHDLNNVLTPIIMAIDLLRIEAPDEASSELLDVVTTSAQRGADMVRQILFFARGVEGQRVEVQIGQVVSDVQRIARDTFPKNVRIQLDLAHDAWTVMGDPTQLHQVLLNLCVNARDAMPHGGVLAISAHNRCLDEHYSRLESEAKPGPYVVLRVEDTGTGIGPEVIDKIFDPFFTTKELGGGTGLGLSTTLGIVKSHGGFMRVYSELGKGTKFKVYLPAQTDESSAENQAVPQNLPRGRGELILVVDDTKAVRDITQQTLEVHGYRVLLACDGAEALLAYAEHGQEIAAMLTDMMMPIMDGLATIRVMKKLNPELPIVAASGLSVNDHVSEVARLGVKTFLAKPYTAQTLLETLHKLLREATDVDPT